MKHGSPNPRVLLIELGLVLNVTEQDLGHPELPGLWQQLRSKPIGAGVLQCLECADKDPLAAVQWMYLRDKPRRWPVHLNPHSAPCLSKGESDLHKAMKDFVVTTAEREGLTATQESRAGAGRVVSDVQISGGGVLLGVEAEIKNSTAEAVVQRSRRRVSAGLQPLWFSDRPRAPFNYRVPSAAIAPTEPWRIAAGLDTKIVEGVRRVAPTRCGTKGPRCPRTGGRPCGRIHAALDYAGVAHLDTLIVGAATAAYMPLEQVTSRSVHFYWVTREDHERYLDDRDGLDAQAKLAGLEELREQRRQSREFDFTCSYTPRRPEPEARSITIPDRPEYRLRPGVCAAGVQPCGAPARLYPGGWRCDNHVPSSP